MVNDTNQIFRPWFKVIVIGFFVIMTVNAVVTKHFSPLRIKKSRSDAKCAEVVDGRLVLNECGVELQFPLLTYMPQNDVIDAALRKGVEICSDGAVLCVLQIECPGFFNPVSYEERYVDLVALAISTDPNCINAVVAEDMPKLMSIIGQRPNDARFANMETDGWRRINTACLDAVTDAISKMPQAKCVQKRVALEKQDDSTDEVPRAIMEPSWGLIL